MILHGNGFDIQERDGKSIQTQTDFSIRDDFDPSYLVSISKRQVKEGELDVSFEQNHLGKRSADPGRHGHRGFGRKHGRKGSSKRRFHGRRGKHFGKRSEPEY